jgi:rubrerythrin
MTIEEAIQHCHEVAEKECTECGKEHLQLAEWLAELKKLRQLQNSMQNDDYALWILEEGDYDIYEGVTPDKYICNKCGCIEYRKSRFCPNCGRTMKL